MKNNINLFATTRKNLALYNSKMLIIFLLLFNVVISSFLFINMYTEQKVVLFDIAKQEIKELIINKAGTQNEDKNNVPVSNINNVQGVFLTYYLDTNKELIIMDEFSPELRESILGKVENWNPDKMETKYEKIQLSNDESLYLLIASQNIYENGVLKGTIYVGKDITFLRSMFIHFLFILLGISLFFLIVALIVGQIMTKRAMKPIINSYTLQTEFIANASHELRTPLSVLKAGIEVIEFEEGKKFSSFSKSVLSDLKEEIRSTTQLVNNLLFLIRSDSGEQATVVESFDLLELMQQTIRSFGHISEAKKIKLNLQVQNPLIVCTEKEKVKQLLYILIDNAIKYTPNGGQVSVSYKLKSDSQNEQLYIEVKDTGMGISKELLERIFDRFYRVDKSRSRNSGSSGLGLSIGKFIVESLNGTIEVSSTLNKGSEFTIIIPLLKTN
ncbi:sensor histidine kinase [Viridibacillus arvi]|uniref:sensor histidine kinase n=1 Tax=Viridibacillus arvi TaxID=263475 RepID=UPI003D29CC11